MDADKGFVNSGVESESLLDEMKKSRFLCRASAAARVLSSKLMIGLSEKTHAVIIFGTDRIIAGGDSIILHQRIGYLFLRIPRNRAQKPLFSLLQKTKFNGLSLSGKKQIECKTSISAPRMLVSECVAHAVYYATLEEKIGNLSPLAV